MNAIPSANSFRSGLLLSGLSQRNRDVDDGPKIEVVRRVETIESAAEESLMSLRSGRLAGVIQDFKPAEKPIMIEEERYTWFNVILSEGSRIVLLFAPTRQRLRQLANKLPSYYRRRAHKIVARIGQDIAKLKTEIANHIRTIFHARTHVLEPDEELRRRAERRKHSRWITRRNVQPTFC